MPKAIVKPASSSAMTNVLSCHHGAPAPPCVPVSSVKPLAIVFRHIVPNLLGIVIVYATLLIPEMILLESFISFLGLGIPAPGVLEGISSAMAAVGDAKQRLV